MWTYNGKDYSTLTKFILEKTHNNTNNNLSNNNK